MHNLKTFISQKFRPEVLGGKLDKNHIAPFKLVKGNKVVKEPILRVNALCFGPKKDNVLINLEHIINKSDRIITLYYEDIHLRWTYINTSHESYFLYQKNELEQYKILPNYLYIRGCHIDPSDSYWLILGDFFNFVDLWEGRVLCAPKKQLSNESKLYQLNNSLKTAAQHRTSISIGQSYVVKGADFFQSLKHDKSYIVKSLSGVRSIVVDKSDYAAWDFHSINNLPVLFQEKAEGNDLRVHVMDKKTFAKRSNFKENIDYRYDKNFFHLTDLDNLEQELIDFCVAVSIEEGNLMLGIDFIQTATGYVVLEANPSPGWSAYHPYNGIDSEPFINELLRVLKSG